MNEDLKKQLKLLYKVLDLNEKNVFKEVSKRLEEKWLM